MDSETKPYNQNNFMSFEKQTKKQISCDCGPISTNFSGKYSCGQCGRIIIADNEIKRKLIDQARKKCIVGNKFQINLVPTITCSDIRKWLLKCHASHLNKHISFINRIITHALGNEVIPPQFNASEENQIIDYWNRISHEYQINCKTY